MVHEILCSIYLSPTLKIHKGWESQVYRLLAVMWVAMGCFWDIQTPSPAHQKLVHTTVCKVFVVYVVVQILYWKLMGPPPWGQRFHLEVFRSLVGVVQAPFPGLLGDITEAGPAGVFWWERRDTPERYSSETRQYGSTTQCLTGLTIQTQGKMGKVVEHRYVWTICVLLKFNATLKQSKFHDHPRFSPGFPRSFLPK